uniref:Flotillin-2 n=1 Tax=Dugesia japonica TaxID=6161 RepID=A0A068CL83_DUGJA|nr:flotillin-2 [Dugesia japonica]APU52172.1 flotillin-2 [Dugesia japonica]
MGNIYTVGPNEALAISGGCCGTGSMKTIIGGWGWAWWLVSQVQKISLEVMTLNPTCEHVETKEGVPLTVTGVAQVKVMTEPSLLATACEQFLGRRRSEIEETILQTLDGHLRAILGTLTVEAIYQDRDQFAHQVREVAAPDVAKMGIEILSFTIKDVYDKVEYLNSLGRAQTAIVKRDADIGVAEAERDAGIREAECEKARMDVRYEADTEIANATRGFQLQKASFDAEVFKVRAEAELAFELQAAKEKQKIRSEEIQIEVVERKKLIEIEEKEILRNEKELDGTVKKPAEAEAFKTEILADARRTKQVLLAQGEAEAIRLKGHAEASSLSAIGKAEAERMRLKAAAYNKYGDAAILSLVLDALPKVAAEVAAPLAKTNEIVILGSGSDSKSDFTGEITKLLGNLPPAVQAMTGVDISQAVRQIPGARVIS